MNPEHGITVRHEGESITCIIPANPVTGHASHRVELGDSVHRMGEWFAGRRASGEPPLFVITGPAGSGKSVFAHALAETGDNVALVDSVSLMDGLPWEHKLDLPQHLPDVSQASTIIIDEIAWCDEASVSKVVESLLHQDKAVVILAQQSRDIPSDLVGKASFSAISHDGLHHSFRRVPTPR